MSGIISKEDRTNVLGFAQKALTPAEYARFTFYLQQTEQGSLTNRKAAAIALRPLMKKAEKELHRQMLEAMSKQNTPR